MRRKITLKAAKSRCIHIEISPGVPAGRAGLRYFRRIMDKDIRKWETLGSEYLIRRPWLTARRDRVRLPSGVVLDEYYVLEYPAWINVIARDKAGDFVMIRQYRHGLDGVFWETVAGVVDPTDKSPLDAAQRELMEETGYGGGQWRQFMTVSPNPGAMNNLTHTFLAEGVERKAAQHLERSEDIAVHLLPGSRVLELLESGAIVQSVMAAPLYKYFYEQLRSRA